MNVTYELWDVETGNIVGAFPTAADALDVVQTLLDAYGPDYSSELSLSERQDWKTARVIGSGQQLIERLEQRHLTGSIHPAARTG
ncbi:MAG: hypothetical protein ACRDJW_06200 [Thermomicrobiales bacterium]